MADPLILAYGKGIIRGFVGNPKGILDLVPVDVVVNVMLPASLPAAASRSFVTRPTEFVSARHESASNATPSSSSLQIKDHENDVQVYHVATSDTQSFEVLFTFTDICHAILRSLHCSNEGVGNPSPLIKTSRYFLTA